jgi:hypothetical protein
MPMTKDRPTATLVAAFDALLIKDVERRITFGHPSAYVRGKMAFGLYGNEMIVRLPDDEVDEFAKRFSARPFEPMPGKPMKAFVVIPSADVDDDAAIGGWVERGLAHAAGMPPKR